MASSKKQKTYSPEKIADLYLIALAKEDKRLLDSFLAANNIYHDVEILSRVLVLLQIRKLVEKVKGSGFFIFSYNPSGTEIHNISGEAEVVPQLIITDKGRWFAGDGQEIDSEGVTSRKTAKQKRTDKLASALISLGVSVGAIIVKWLFIDK